MFNQERLIHVDAVKGSGGPVKTCLVSFVTSIFPGNVYMFNDFESKCLITFISELFEMLCGGLAYRHIWFDASMILSRCWNIGRCGF